MSLETILEQYNYEFPSEAIANKPAIPRESAQLLVYSKTTQQRDYSTFAHIGSYLPHKTVLVFNQSKVIPARFTATKENGTTVELLFIRSLDDHTIVVKSPKKLKLTELLRVPGSTVYNLQPTSHSSEGYTLTLNFTSKELLDYLDRYGTTPLPPYIKSPLLSPEENKVYYQTVFAAQPGSIAAPTASLHFTDELIESLKAKGVSVEFVTLHVGLGTFASVTNEQFTSKTLHHEEYEVEAETAKRLVRYKQEGYTIIPVGTTSLRTLETVFTGTEVTAPLRGSTNLFIQEGYEFRFINGLITNFHVPKSSLLMLVASFVGRENILELYKDAIQRGFKLFSYGDGMLLLP